jgi:GNAT superfamily N-acetyltransferase
MTADPDEIPDKNIFMMCRALRRDALSELPAPYRLRSMRADEYGIWKAFPFDDAATAAQYDAFMEDWFRTTYGGKEALFFERTQFAIDEHDRPVATCMVWMSYGTLPTIHWLKVRKDHEGHGLGRAILSAVMRDLDDATYPVYLHTQPASFRAIKLYSDVGFDLLSGDRIGSRTNDLADCLPILQAHMPAAAFASLRITEPPPELLDFLATTTTVEF